MKSLNFSTKQPKALVALSAVIVILIIGYMDYVTHELGLSVFYVAVILLATWFSDKRLGVVCSAIAAAVWTLAQVLAGKTYYYAFAPYWNFGVRIALFSIIAFLTSRARFALNLESKLARKDSLTNTANWLAFSEIAEREIARSRRYKCPLTTVYFDLDNFKSINDSLGHKAGDNFLRFVADLFQESLRAVDVFARIGGDEFVILLPETGYDGAQNITKKLHALFLEHVQKQNVAVTFSMGVAVFNEVPDSVDIMVAEADKLMYQAKKNGKNRIQYSLIGAKSQQQ